MEVKASTEIGVPLARSWPMLHDVTLVASCLPGARLLDGPDADGEYRGQLTVQFGPTRVSFAGRAALEYHDEARTVAIRARGQDARGRTRAVARVDVRADETSDGRTSLCVSGTIDVTGALERFAATGGARLADEMIRAFAANLGTYLGQSDADQTAGPGTPGRASGGRVAGPDLGDQSGGSGPGGSGPGGSGPGGSGPGGSGPGGSGLGGSSLGGSGPGATATARPRPPEPAPLRLGTLLLAIVKRWLRRGK
jgi:carbon monoxide dehydrogenase subunit G